MDLATEMRLLLRGSGGGDWIRTSVPEGPDLQSGAFNRSATPPRDRREAVGQTARKVEAAVQVKACMHQKSKIGQGGEEPE